MVFFSIKNMQKTLEFDPIRAILVLTPILSIYFTISLYIFIFMHLSIL